ncbi:N-acetylglucosamine-6-phosphate deacetylase [Devosia sp. 66-22]|uniref:N-acetylglucosamine-6-phosphate deacetylase n=1 Tax=Devosia sp. 66-22 TaxID=1895753 RepID=UPI00092B3B5C|nr:N-acetylglucosamine-6-phosphate deacetylase [Devosia sp. 66-22]OJX51626.1 MAG: N-acetylglucosamine-6-phosphate deacetylase [Devosia sp. 66-22]
MTRIAFTGARIFDGEAWWDQHALVVADGKIEGIIAADSPTDAERMPMGGGILAPGFIDLQVNGGGGALLNLDPTLDSIRTICATFARFGTTACLPTLITDTREKNAAVMAAGAEATRIGVPGFLGLHLEGPHLSIARKGAHDPALIRPMDEADLVALVNGRRNLPNLLTTVAAETVTPNQITRLREGGLVVSIGHSDAGYAVVRTAMEAGATMVTHLFNAQSQLGNRDPGVVGAALDLGGVHAGLIADGIHVHEASLGVALRAKRGPGRIFLVTDAMSITGTDWESFELTGQTVYRKDGALRLANGTLAGADLTMIDAVTYVHRIIGLPLEEALRMASLYPAEALGVDKERGRIAPGLRADLVHLSDELSVRGTLIGGETAYAA